VPITTDFVSSNLAHGEVLSIHYYVLKFVSNLLQVGGLIQLPYDHDGPWHFEYLIYIVIL
jgi:hypothetical protein